MVDVIGLSGKSYVICSNKQSHKSIKQALLTYFHQTSFLSPIHQKLKQKIYLIKINKAVGTTLCLQCCNFHARLFGQPKNNPKTFLSLVFLNNYIMEHKLIKI